MHVETARPPVVLLYSRAQFFGDGKKKRDIFLFVYFFHDMIPGLLLRPSGPSVRSVLIQKASCFCSYRDVIDTMVW